jgi:hypothetical protein
MSKHRVRKAAYAAGARDALDSLRDELRWIRPLPSIVSSMDVLINRTRRNFRCLSLMELRRKIALHLHGEAAIRSSFRWIASWISSRNFAPLRHRIQ